LNWDRRLTANAITVEVDNNNMKMWHLFQTWFSVNKVDFLLFFLLVSVYAYTFPRWADPNQNSRLNMVVAVVEDRTFKIDPYVSNTVDYAKVGEHYYSDKAPGTAFLGIPVYAVMKVFLDLPVMNGVMESLSNNAAFQATLREGGTGILAQKVRFAIAQIALSFLFAAVPSALVGILIFRLSEKLTQQVWVRAAVVIIYGLLTPVFAYAGAFYGHQLSAALIFGVFYLAWKYADAFTIPKAVMSGIFLAYSVVTEYPVALLAGVIFLYLIYRLYQSRDLIKIGWVIVAGMLVAAGWMVYNNAIFGGPLKLGYEYSELWTDQHGTGFMSLTLPHLDAVWGITFSPFRGLFFYSPLLLLAIPGFYLWWRASIHRLELWVAVLSVGIIFLFNASSIMWWGGFAIGPRYLLPMLPFMMLPMIFAAPVIIKSGVLKVLFVVLAGWSWIAVWGITLAGQAFPPDTIRNPLIEYALPFWQTGNIARNAGTIIGLRGLSSLLPLVGIVLLFLVLMYPFSASGKVSLAREKSDLQ
jgi:hypothetical protein